MSEERIAKFQLQKFINGICNGWAGIGYHYVIHKDGRIEQGRPEGTIGAHCYGYNQTSIGIVSVGNFDIAWPTKQQLSSATHLVAYLCQRYHI